MGPPGATFAHFGGIFGYLGLSFVHVYAFLLGFREHLCIFRSAAPAAGRSSRPGEGSPADRPTQVTVHIGLPQIRHISEGGLSYAL